MKACCPICGLRLATKSLDAEVYICPDHGYISAQVVMKSTDIPKHRAVINVMAEQIGTEMFWWFQWLRLKTDSDFYKLQTRS